MKRKCGACLCNTCLEKCCDQKGCADKKETCENYIGFKQESIFLPELKLRRQPIPRHPWQHYGISEERRRQLTEYIQSGRYAHLASRAAHTADSDAAEYILLSITKSLSFDSLGKLYGRGEIGRIPCSRTGFYYAKKYFYSLFDKELRRIGK